MKKTWNVTLYRDGKPVSEQRGVSESDAVAQIYLLSRTTAPVEAVEENRLAPRDMDTRELALAAAA
ncbi:MAG: hypothetical protein QM729_19055 [Solirubrobacterales bacterium]